MKVRLKSVADLVTDCYDHGPLPYVALENLESGTGHLLPGTELPERENPESGAALVEPGDVLFGKLRPYLAKSLLADRTMYASTELLCLRPHKTIDSRWLSYLISSRSLVDWAIATSDGAKMPRTSWDKLAEFRVKVPSFSTQRATADFLDAETARIDTFIEKKLRMVNLFEERRLAIRESLLQVDSGWRLKHLLAAPMAYGVLVPEFVDPGAGVSMIRISDLDSRGCIRLDNVAWIPESLSAQYQRTLVQPGDLVLSVVGSMGRAAVVPPEFPAANLNRPMARLRPRQDLPSRLLWHWTQTREFLDQARLAVGSGTAQPTLNLGDLAQFKVGLPRDPSEWGALAYRLDQECALLDRAEDAVSHQTGVLQERRQALVTATVAGELDISGVAA